jgi:hypothetical protein
MTRTAMKAAVPNFSRMYVGWIHSGPMADTAARVGAKVTSVEATSLG